MSFSLEYSISKKDINKVAKESLYWTSILLRFIFYPYVIHNFFVAWSNKNDIAWWLTFALIPIVMMEVLFFIIKFVKRKLWKNKFLNVYNFWKYKVYFSKGNVRLVEIWEDKKINIEWNRIRKFIKTKNYILIHFEKAYWIFIVPQNILDGESNKTKFIEYLEEQVEERENQNFKPVI